MFISHHSPNYSLYSFSSFIYLCSCSHLFSLTFPSIPLSLPSIHFTFPTAPASKPGDFPSPPDISGVSSEELSTLFISNLSPNYSLHSFSSLPRIHFTFPNNNIKFICLKIKIESNINMARLDFKWVLN